MFSRVAHLARGPLRRVASRGFSARAVAALPGSRNVSLLAGSAAVVAAGLAVATTQQQRAPAHCHHDKFPYTGVPGTSVERTFIAVKPDGVQRQLVGEVITRFEKKGYKLVAMKMIWPTKEMSSEHYADLSQKPFYKGLVEYFSSGPIVAMVWEGPEVILTGRKMLGATNPNSSNPGSLRGDYCIRVGRNLIHGSDGPDSAQHEIGFWFTEIPNQGSVVVDQLMKKGTAGVILCVARSEENAGECSDWHRTLDEWIVADN